MQRIAGTEKGEALAADLELPALDEGVAIHSELPVVPEEQHAPVMGGHLQRVTVKEGVQITIMITLIKYGTIHSACNA